MSALSDPEDPLPNERPTSPFGTEPPFPRHDSLPAEMVGERKTDPAPATLDGVRDLLVQLIGEHHEGLNGVYQSIGGVVERLDGISGAVARIEARVEGLERLHGEQVTHLDGRIDEVKQAAMHAGNGAIEAAARVEVLWQSFIKQASFNGEQIAELEQSVTKIQEDAERRSAGAGGE